MRRLFVFIVVFAAILTYTAVYACAVEESSGESSGEFDGYTVTFTRGYNFINPLTGAEADHLFTGKIPDHIKVEKGGSFVFPENTIKFYDYVFVCWKYAYKDKDGKTVVEKYLPGDTYENVTDDMTVSAVWKRPDPIKLVISGYMSYNKGDEYAEGTDISPFSVTCGQTVKLAGCPYAKDGYDFAGWVDSDGILYQAGATYTVAKANPVLTAVWKKNGESILTHTVVYKGGEGNITGKGPSQFEMYKKTSFRVAANTFVRDGYAFLYWEDEAGGKYYPGDVFDVSPNGDPEIVLTAVWAEAKNSFKIKFSLTGPGIISPSGDAVVDEGGTYSFNVIADSGCRVKSVTINGEAKEIKQSYVIDDIKSDVNVSVVFEKITSFIVNVNCGKGGVAYIEGGVATVTEGGSVTVHISSDNGYYAKTVYVNGSPVEYSGGALVINNITEDINVEIEFAAFDETSGTVSSISGHGESMPLEVEPPSDIKYVYILAALAVLMSLGFIVFRIRK